MQTSELIRKHADLAGELLGLDLSTPQGVEEFRHRMGGHFGVTHYRRANRWGDREIISQEMVHNIVTNEGLDHALDVALSGATQITAWKVAAVKTNTSPAAGMTYATPTYTEIAGSDVTETVRQAWTDGGVSSQSVDNSASPATYTANATVTLYGAGLVGGGTAATTIANTAGGGTLWSMALFGTSKAMVATDTIDITYTQSSADDGV